MLGQYKYTEKERKEILKSMVILVDTREQENKHILEILDKKKISYKIKKLDYGDYSFYVPENKELGIMRDTYFDNMIAIERKNSLEELSNNLTRERSAFENEFIRAHNDNCKFIVMVEVGGLKEIAAHAYRTNLGEKAYFASVLSFEQKYDAQFIWHMKDIAGKYIYERFGNFLSYHLRKGVE